MANPDFESLPTHTEQWLCHVKNHEVELQLRGQLWIFGQSITKFPFNFDEENFTRKPIIDARLVHFVKYFLPECNYFYSK
jgi:hypothetical protein